MSIPIPLFDQEDEFIWGPAANGNFSIKSATWIQYNDLSPHPKTKLLNLIWKLDIPPKVKIFTWLLIRGRLKTRDRLSRFVQNMDANCALCHNSIESLNHLFYDCPFAHNVWHLSGLYATPINAPNLISWLDDLVSLNNDKLLLSHILLICWQIWDSRNKWIFQQVTPHPTKVVNVAYSLGCEFWHANPPQMCKKNDFSSIKWKPPDTSFAKLNFDGAVSHTTSAAIGFIIRDDMGNPLLVGAKKSHSLSVPVTEALALREGLSTAFQRGIKKIQVEGDSKLVIDCIRGSTFIPWRLKYLVADIKELAESLIQFLSIMSIVKLILQQMQLLLLVTLVRICSFG